MRTAAILLALALGACGHNPEPRIEYRPGASIPVPVSCVPADPPLREEPVYPDTVESLKAAKDPAALLQLLGAGRILREQWLSEVRPVLAACRKVPKPQ